MRKRLVVAALVVVAAALPALLRSPYLLHIAVMSFLYVMLAQSLNLVLGYCGLLSLASPAFFGIGAYAGALAALKLGWDTALVVCGSAIAGALAGAVIGYPSLRTSRHSFVIVTLSFALLLQLVALNWDDVTRGALGLSNIPPARFFGIEIRSGLGWYCVSAVAAAAAMASTWLVSTSRFGRAMLATRDNDVLALACGIDVFRTRLIAFCMSAALAALAGTLYAHYISYIDPGVFGFSLSETLLIMVILGGSATLWGPLFGAFIFTAVPELLRLTPELRSLLYGAILLAVVLYRPRFVRL